MLAWECKKVRKSQLIYGIFKFFDFESTSLIGENLTEFLQYLNGHQEFISKKKKGQIF